MLLNHFSTTAASITPLAATGFRRGPLLTVETQCRSNWCWAAVAHSVAKWKQSALHGSQEELVYAVLKNLHISVDKADCIRNACGTALTGSGNVTLDFIPFSKAGVKSRAGGMQLQEAELQQELKSGKPVGAFISWAGGGDHAIAIVGGFTDAASNTFYYISDPLSPAIVTQSFSQLETNYRNEVPDVNGNVPTGRLSRPFFIA